MTGELLNVSGVTSEGLYRVAGFHDDVEAIKMAFDKGYNNILQYFKNYSS